jgi:hypothetical protein
MKPLVLAAAVAAALTVGAAAGRAAIYFDFHKVTNTGSSLMETWQDGSTGKVYAQQSWRAGSGYTTNGCQVDAGWLPNGYYTLASHQDHYDLTIKGRVWHFDDKQCSDGTWRRELFIHSEETADNGQLCGYPYYDERYCWDGDGDYKSVGCIKVAHAQPYPSDIAKVDNDWHNWGGGTGTLNLYRRVYVYS